MKKIELEKGFFYLTWSCRPKFKLLSSTYTYILIYMYPILDSMLRHILIHKKIVHENQKCILKHCFNMHRKYQQKMQLLLLSLPEFLNSLLFFSLSLKIYSFLNRISRGFYAFELFFWKLPNIWKWSRNKASLSLIHTLNWDRIEEGEGQIFPKPYRETIFVTVRGVYTRPQNSKNFPRKSSGREVVICLLWAQ